MGWDRVLRSTAALALIMATTACSGDGGQSSTSTTRPSVTTTTTEPELVGSPRAPDVAAEIVVDGGPDWMGVEGGALWVKTDSGEVVRIDPATNTVAATIDVAPPSPCQGLGVGFGSVWSCDNGDIVRIDTATNTITATITAGKFNVQGRIVTGFDRVWVLVDGGETLAGIDPATNAIATRIDLGVVGFDLAIDADSVWVAAGNEATLLRVDPATEQVIARIEGLPAVRSISVSEAVWVVYAGGTARVDRATNEVTLSVPVRGDTLFASGDAVWVRDEGDAYLRKLDPLTGELVDSLSPPLGPDIGDVLIAVGSLWASSSDVSRVYRFSDGT